MRKPETEEEKNERYQEMAKDMMKVFSASEKAGIRFHNGLPILPFQRYVELRDTEKMEKEAKKFA
jgi:hypothetical protein